MNLIGKKLIVGWLGIALLTAVAAMAQSGPLKDDISQHEQKLAAARQANSASEEATELNVLGFLYRQAGKMQKALQYLNDAMPIERNENNLAAQAMTENIMGRIYTDLGQEEQALDALPSGAAGMARAGSSPDRGQHAELYRQSL